MNEQSKSNLKRRCWVPLFRKQINSIVWVFSTREGAVYNGQANDRENEVVLSGKLRRKKKAAHVGEISALAP